MFKKLLFSSSARALVRGTRAHSGGASITPQHRVSAYDSFVLRITRTVKEPVPEVSLEKMEKANSRFRIGIMFTMMGFSFLGSVYAVMQGKRNARNHLSISQKNRDRHRNAARKAEE